MSSYTCTFELPQSKATPQSYAIVLPIRPHRRSMFWPLVQAIQMVQKREQERSIVGREYEASARYKVVRQIAMIEVKRSLWG